MPDTIGEKIRILRKQMNLTQSQLAGSEMTKGMLSQIENNIAKPSMKNLQYLANRLDKPISFFIDNNYRINESLPMEEISKIVSASINAVKRHEYNNVILQLKELLGKYRFDESSKIYAVILSTLGEALVHIKDFDEGEDNLKNAVSIYKTRHMYAEAAKTYMKLTARYLDKFQYEKCIEIINAALDIYKSSIDGDSVFEIEMLYQKAVMLYGMGHTSEPLSLLLDTLEISKETGIYYISDEVYKLISVIYLFQDKYTDFLYNINKAKQFAEFTENNLNLASVEFAMSMYENSIFNPEKALSHIENLSNYLGRKTRVYFLEKAKSLYLMERYREAKEQIDLVEYPNKILDKVDFLYMWSGKIYEGLIENKLGNVQKALDLILLGIEKMELMTPSKYHVFAYKSLSEVYSDTGDFEKAFAALKKADQMQTELNH